MDAALRQWYLTNTYLLSFFKLKFPQRNYWRLYPAPLDVRREITSALRNGRKKWRQRMTVPHQHYLLTKMVEIMFMDHHRPRPIQGIQPHTISPFFYDRVQVDALATNSVGTKKRTVAGYLRGVAQIFVSVGPKTPTWTF